MADPTFASDVPDEWRRGFIASYYAQHGTWPTSSTIEAEYARAWIVAEHGPWDRENECYADGTRSRVALAEYDRHRRASRSSGRDADCPECGDIGCRCGIDWTAPGSSER